MAAELSYESIEFDQLKGWEEDDHSAALTTFLNTCGDLKDPDWSSLCGLAKDQRDAKTFFESFFMPVIARGSAPGFFTGYFEPELKGALTPSDRFAYPVYALPDDLEKPWPPRRRLLEDRLLEGRGLEIAWVEDPVELFFLQVQGSGRIQLPEGTAMRVGYAGTNGQPYQSIGKELIRRGGLAAHEASADAIKSWVRANPEAGKELLYHNPSYVFFREVSHVPAHLGPLGAMDRSITAMRTIAVDPMFVPLGAPVWIEKAGEEPLHRLMVAQDTGSAIKGAQRADIFFGTGAHAGQRAGRIRDHGRMAMLLPIRKAHALVSETPQ